MTDQSIDAPPAKRRISPIAVTVVIVAVLILGFLGAASVITEVLWYQQLDFLPVLTTQWIAAGVMFLIGFFAMAVPIFLSIDIAYRKRPVYARLTGQLDRYQDLIEPLRRVIKWLLPAVIGLFAGFAAATQWQRALLWMHAAPTGTTDPEFGLDVSFFLFDLPFWRGVVGFASAVALLSLIVGVATSYLYGGITFSGRDVRVSKATRIQSAVLATLYLLLQGVSLWLDQYAVLTDSTGRFTGGTFSGVHAVIPGKQILAGIAVLVAVLFLVTAFTGKWRLPVIGTVLLLVSALVVGAGYPWAVQTLQVKPDEKTMENEYLARNIAATRAAYGVDHVEVERYDATTDAEPGQLRSDAVATANIRIIDPAVVSPTFAQLEQVKQYYQFPDQLSVDRYEIDGKVEDTVSGIRDIDISGQTGWYNRTLVYTHGYGLVAAYGNQRTSGGEPVFIESGIPTSGKLGEFEPRVYFGMHSPDYSIVGGERDTPIELDYPADDEAAPDDAETPADDTDAVADGDDSTGSESTEPETTESETTAESGETVEVVADADGSRQNLTTFSGDGGPKLDNIFTKLIYALKFQDMEVVLSGAVVDGSQVLYHRSPVERLQKVAPYLTVDSAPYASVVDGRIVWIVDGYTTSNDYPYSERRDMSRMIADADNPSGGQYPNGVNYIRNSVKATVDAYDGSVKLYAWDEEDPLLKAWGEIFPDTLHSVSEMSGDLLSHVRYPSDLFKVQREILATYHVTDPGAFFSDEDAWRTPNNPVSNGTTAATAATATTGATGATGTTTETSTARSDALKQPPYYLTLAAGANADPNFSIYSTYIPRAEGANARDILTGYLAANANAGSEDGKVSSDYGKLKLLTLPKSTSIPGPGQMQNNFTTNSEVSRLLNLLRQGESKVISGNLLTLPVGGGLLYVQPVYVRASSGTSFPILQKVLVSFGEEIAFEDTLDAALDELFGGNSGAPAGDGDIDDPGTGEEPGTEDPGSEGSGGDTPDLEEALRDMEQAIADRDAAMKDGDWSAYGEADERLRDALERALRAG
ncbi:UPF0182 family protein [Leucobacter soli]|uniref:UPF0182 family membrane protein n=1 Tax=Leucobacter soli TaxID=2812850 RepID=UPI001C407542|nr:UPF0182 family protein [Leucobacter soli]